MPAVLALCACALVLWACANSPHVVDDPSASRWRYEVDVGPQADELAVEAFIDAGSNDELSVRTGAEPFVHDVEIEHEEQWSPLDRRGTSWFRPGSGAVHLRYRFALKEAARGSRNPEIAADMRGAFVASPSSWLLHPLEDGGATFRMHVVSPPDSACVCGFFPARDGARDTYEGQAEDLGEAPFCVFAPRRVEHLRSGDSMIDLAITPGSIPVSDEEIVHWTTNAVKAIEAYYGAYPVPHVALIVTSAHGNDIEGGKTEGNSGAAILIGIGRNANVRALAHDWTLTHEMVHLALPSLPEPHHWLEEGSATYVESIARAQVGLLSEADVWKEFVESMPQGLPEKGDKGLDHTPTWGRVYWGGALFCLLADVDILERTNQRASLREALGAVVRAGGNVGTSWPIERVLEVGDRAVGVPALRELYARMANDPMPVDLDALWKRLGVAVRGGRVVFDDDAPLAAVRKTMTRPR